MPFDTTLEKASQICNDPELGMTDLNKIGIWSPEKQAIINPKTQRENTECALIKYQGLDFDLEPGQVYYITIPRAAMWTQK